jgi:acyl carrier protein
MSVMDFEEGSARAVIVNLVSARLGLDPAMIGVDKDLVRDLGADSLDVLVLAGQIESTFDVSVSQEELERLHTIRDILAALAQSCARRGKGR